MNDQAKRQARRIRRVFADELVKLRQHERFAATRLQDTAKALKVMQNDHTDRYSDADLDRADANMRHADDLRSSAQGRISMVEGLRDRVEKILGGGKA